MKWHYSLNFSQKSIQELPRDALVWIWREQTSRVCHTTGNTVVKSQALLDSLTGEIAVVAVAQAVFLLMLLKIRY